MFVIIILNCHSGGFFATKSSLYADIMVAENNIIYQRIYSNVSLDFLAEFSVILVIINFSGMHV